MLQILGVNASRHHLGEHRDFWWNPDFMRLLIARWKAESVETLLDVGCGRGAWSELLSLFLPNLRQLVGVDRDERWIAQCSAASKTRAVDPLSRRYLTCSVERLESLLPETFDMVTCQTLLCHVADPRRAIEAMLAVLKPGGLLVLVEPSNRTLQLVGDSSRPAFDIDAELRRAAFYMKMEKGKLLLGEGDNSVGDRLEQLLRGLEITERQGYLSDKLVALRPPYDDEPGMDAWRRQIVAWAENDVWIWPRARSRHYFLAGGGSAGDFEEEWAREMKALRQMADHARASTLSMSGGRLMYVQSGRKPGRALVHD